jgi:hypothetical protein
VSAGGMRSSDISPILSYGGLIATLSANIVTSCHPPAGRHTPAPSPARRADSLARYGSDAPGADAGEFGSVTPGAVGIDLGCYWSPC